MEGHEGNTTWRVRNGLLEMEVEGYKSKSLVHLLTLRIRHMTWGDSVTSISYKNIHRIARMCYELSLENRLTMIDRDDAQVLYEVDLSEATEWLNKILNQTRLILRKTGDVSIVTADHFAKDLHGLVES